jgi:DNA-binding NarL/FixJ family response regulator
LAESERSPPEFRRARIRLDLADLPSNQRRLVVVLVAKGFPYKVVAGRCSISEGRVKQHIRETAVLLRANGYFALEEERHLSNRACVVYWVLREVIGHPALPPHEQPPSPEG